MIAWRSALAFTAPFTVAAGIAAAEPPRLAVFDFELIDTSLEGPRPDQERRLRLLDAELRDQLARSGHFALVDIAPVRERLARGPALAGCKGCAIDLAQALGADLVLTGTVQKVSNLILNINLALREAPGGAPRFAASADIRGNTDESWLRGLRWLLRNRLLAQPEGAAGRDR
jgi:hypothetical protein